jgi:hypothetical protein
MTHAGDWMTVGFTDSCHVQQFASHQSNKHSVMVSRELAAGMRRACCENASTGETHEDRDHEATETDQGTRHEESQQPDDLLLDRKRRRLAS